VGSILPGGFLSALSPSSFYECYIDPREISKSSNLASIRVEEELRTGMFSSTPPHYKEVMLPSFVIVV